MDAPVATGRLGGTIPYLLDHAGADVAERFFDAAIAALRAIKRMLGTDSPRVGELCDIPGLRVRRIARFSCG